MFFLLDQYYFKTITDRNQASLMVNSIKQICLKEAIYKELEGPDSLQLKMCSKFSEAHVWKADNVLLSARHGAQQAANVSPCDRFTACCVKKVFIWQEQLYMNTQTCLILANHSFFLVLSNLTGSSSTESQKAGCCAPFSDISSSNSWPPNLHSLLPCFWPINNWTMPAKLHMGYSFIFL